MARAMVARLGNVLCWLGCAVAALALALTALVAFGGSPDAPRWWPIYAAIAVVAWLVGRALKYILAGR